MLPRSFIFIFFLLLFGLRAEAAPRLRCGVCGAANARLFGVKGLSSAEEKFICVSCLMLEARCTICRLPVSQNNSTRLEDGRLLCQPDHAAGIFTPQEVERVLYETKQELTRVFWQYMRFPQTNLAIAVVNARELHKLYDAPYNPANVSLWGLTQTQTLIRPNEKETSAPAQGAVAEERPVFKHRIYLLSGMPRARLMAVCAHEFAHVWLNENLKPTRELDRDTVEGFCELVAYQLMDSLGESFEKTVIAANLYTGDQATTLIETEKQYGFYRILEWMRAGVDQRISVSDLDRIRLVTPPQATAPAPLYTAPTPVLPAPEKLVLKGLSGNGPRRFALINNRTLSQNEEAQVRVGLTNVTVRCLEIREKSVIIDLGGTNQQELFLDGR